MDKPLISIIIPVYNVEAYLEECLDSVLKQTYENMEIITINDGSNDKSLKILEEYSLQHNNITVISQKNSGQSVARNNGIKIAKGKYLYFLDADDFILPDTFEHLINKMEKNNLDLIRFSAEPFVDNFDKQIDNNQYDYSALFDSTRVYNKEEALKKNYLTYTPSPVLYILKKSLLFENNILFKPGIIHEDDLFTLEVFINCKALMYDTKQYYKRRYRPNSTMTTKTLEASKKSFDSRCIIYSELIMLLDKYYDKHELILINKIIRSVRSSLIFDYPDLDRKYKKEKIKMLNGISKKHYIEAFIQNNVIKYLKPFRKNVRRMKAFLSRG